MTFAHPVWLVVLAVLPLLAIGAVLAARFRRRPWDHFVAPRLRAALVKAASPLPQWLALGLLLAACATLILALARPRGDNGTRTEKALGRNLLIALDLSRSMRVADVKPDRLAQAKMIIYELLEAMPNERIGLLGFAGNAYMYAPLTVDHAAVRETVEQIDETWAPLGGTNLGAALKLATATLKKTGQKNNALVIISDGEKHDSSLDSAIADARAAGVFILAIGVGTEDGNYVPNSDFPGNRTIDRNGKPVISRLQPAVLRQLANQTHGRFALAGSGVDIPAMVKSAVKDLDAFEMEGRERRFYIEFYQWLVLPAIMLLLGSLLVATRWRRIGTAASAAAAMLCLTPGGLHADQVAAAKQAISQHHDQEARDAYQKLADQSHLPERRAKFRLGEATAAYRAGDFTHARAAFSAALQGHDPAVQAAAHNGLGNSLFQLGWQSLAGSPYPADAPPDLSRFDELVKQRLAQLTQNEAADETPNNTGSLDNLITDWADAVRHFDSARSTDPANAVASNNRETTMVYLQRLAELLKENRQQTQQALPQPGEGEPQPNDGEPKESPEGSEGNQQDPKASDSNKENPPRPDEGKDGQPKDDDKQGKADEPKDKQPGMADESPEERARRILKENADLEKGPLTPGRRELQNPSKDW